MFESCSELSNSITLITVLNPCYMANLQLKRVHGVANKVRLEFEYLIRWWEPRADPCLFN